MQLHEMNLWQVMIFRLYILYNKHKMIKIGTQNRKISQVLSQVLEYFFFCRLYLCNLEVDDDNITDISDDAGQKEKNMNEPLESSHCACFLPSEEVAIRWEA